MDGVKKKRGVRQAPPNPHDEADAVALDAAVMFAINNYLSRIDHTRPVGSFNKQDLKLLASDFISGWILKRAELAACGNETISQEQSFSAPFALGT